MDRTQVDPKRIVTAGYDRIAEQYCAWSSQVRREERAKYTAVLLEKLPEGAAVLDVGCGAGLCGTTHLRARGKLYRNEQWSAGLGHYGSVASALRSVCASSRSAVSKPSVNQL